MRGALPVLLVGLVFLVLSNGGSVPGAPTKPANVDRSLDRLRPLFRAKVERLLARMKDLGFRPMVWEAYRSKERAERLAKQGAGIERSQHTVGLAVDIIDQEKQWSAEPAFWAALDREARSLGLTRVRHRDKNGNLVPDLPHVQALPGALDAQAYAASDEQRDALLFRQYKVG